jgi:O-antigen ligase
MSDTQTSLSAMPLIQHARMLLSDARTAFKDLPNWEKPIHVFWLLGPFILLIERSPADIWLSLLAVIFAARAFWQRDGSWLRHLWVRAAFMFWAVCLLSAGSSTAPGYALGETFSWFRFPLFAMATVFWLGKDKRLIYLMLLSTGVGMMIMTGILTAEILIQGQTHGRLLWPYGDLNPGNYLAKAGMPAFCVMVAFAVGARGKTSLVMGALVSFSLALSVLTGERVNLLLRVCAGVLTFLSWKINGKRFLAAISIFSALILPVFVLQGSNDPRFTLAVLNDLPTNASSDYYRKMGGGIAVFLDSPLVGIGTANYRDLCPTILAENSTFRCDNHPHNYFIQMLAETGILGFATGLFMICTIIWTLFRNGRANNQNVAAATAFIVPLGLFFPLQSTPDFFGQWNNIFMWSAVALSMASVNLLPNQNQTHK